MSARDDDDKEWVPTQVYLCERAAVAFREGRIIEAECLASAAGNVLECLGKDGFLKPVVLTWGGAPLEEANAAVASLRRGAEPTDSLVGQVRKLLAIAERKDDDGGSDGEGTRAEGEAHALRAVLDLLGVKP